MEMKEIRPARNKIFVRPLKVPAYRSGEMVVPETVSEVIPPQQGEVIAVGAGVESVEVGENVLYGRGMEVEFSTFSVIPQEAVVCKVEHEVHAGDSLKAGNGLKAG